MSNESQQLGSQELQRQQSQSQAPAQMGAGLAQAAPQAQISEPSAAAPRFIFRDFASI